MRENYVDFETLNNIYSYLIYYVIIIRFTTKFMTSIICEHIIFSGHYILVTNNI